jgi:hypothetical protein
MTDKLTDLDERVTDINAQCSSLTDHLTTVVDVNVPDLHAHLGFIKDMQDQAEATKHGAQGHTMSDDHAREVEEAKAKIAMLRDQVNGTFFFFDIPSMISTLKHTPDRDDHALRYHQDPDG